MTLINSMPLISLVVEQSDFRLLQLSLMLFWSATAVRNVPLAKKDASQAGRHISLSKQNSACSIISSSKQFHCGRQEMYKTLPITEHVLAL